MASIAEVAGMVMFWLVETLYMLLLSLLAAVWTLPLQYLCYYVGYAPEVFSAAVAPMKDLAPVIAQLWYRLWRTRLVVTGDKMVREKAFVICNHSSYHDNVFVLSGQLPQVFGMSHRDIRWIAKKDLLVHPLGWTMYMAKEILIARSAERDMQHIRQRVKDFKHENVQLFVIFPEGTRATDARLDSARKFASSRGLPALEHVLMPRVKGTQLILEEAHKNGSFNAVYDITLGYKPDHRKIVLSCPNEVHCHIERIDIASVPHDADGVSNWLMKRWERKDKLLKQFYATGHFAVN